MTGQHGGGGAGTRLRLIGLLAAHVALLLHGVSWTVTLLQAVLQAHRLSTDPVQADTRALTAHCEVFLGVWLGAERGEA